MASLRQRLAKRTAVPDLQQSRPSAESKSESSGEAAQKAPATTSDVKGGIKQSISIAPDDLSTTPPPDRRLRSSKDFSRDKTPPKSLLEKYKDRSAKHAVTTVTAASEKTAATGKNAVGKERDSRDHSLSGAGRPSEPPKHTAPKTGETHKVNGVEFDMLNQSKVNAEPIRHGPTQGEHRRTRSQTRRDEKASSMEDLLCDDLKLLQIDCALEPPPLSIRKVDRTPSPRASKSHTSPASQESAAAPSLTAKEQRPNGEDDRTAKIDQSVADMISPPTESFTVTGTPSKIKSILKSRHSPDSGNLGIHVSPPCALNAPVGYVFCSDKGNTSRPVEPWAWSKKWTCCTCGDSEEWQKPALTMAEQKICSRLNCGHVRCGACRLVQEARFATGGPFSR